MKNMIIVCSTSTEREERNETRHKYEFDLNLDKEMEEKDILLKIPQEETHIIRADVCQKREEY